MSRSVRPIAFWLTLAGVVAAVAIIAGQLELGARQSVVAMIGVLALATAVTSLEEGRTDRDEATTPETERRAAVPVPGTSVRDGIGEFGPGRGSGGGTVHLVPGLRSVAVAALTRFRGDTPDEARSALEAGSWTADERAARFLATGEAAPESRRERVAARLGRADPYAEALGRTARAITRIGYGGDDGGLAADERATSDERTTSEDEGNPAGDRDRLSSARTARRSASGIVEVFHRETNHWNGIGVVALAALGLGAIAESPGLLLAGAVGVGYAGFARSITATAPDLGLERTVDVEQPEPGEEVEVTVTVTNEGDGILWDLRFVDGVPGGLTVVDGSPRVGTVLRPGESATVEYTLVAEPGEHAFDPGLAIVGDLSRSTEREFLVPCETPIRCDPTARPTDATVPLRPSSSTFAGRLTTGDGGAGTTFHSVREYRRGDPMNRIDWNRHARTGELATIDFHEERAARVLLLVDARREAYVAPGDGVPHAVDRSTTAAGRLATTLLDAGDAVGLAAIGTSDRREGSDDPADACWLPPSSGPDHRLRLRELLRAHPQLSSAMPPPSGRWVAQVSRIRRRLSAETHVVLFTPLTDVVGTIVARRLASRGHPVVVVSPDPTADRTAGQVIARVCRRIRRHDLQSMGIPVVDWPAREPIDETLLRLDRRGGPP
ncbi:DUF58 domain-containing protein [Halovivax sp.]|uniref:DUF58 domain-containing protein n=1 Tax=Halovivax sp. TaxID=1935978 RepID=UPI0025BD8834|nr:DUF58 domain-containing protein [Halovivax sp.]